MAAEHKEIPAKVNLKKIRRWKYLHTTSDTLLLALGLRGAWWLRAERQARIRWMAPISRAMRRSRTPSSVVSGVLLNRARRTWKGSVGNTLADGDCKMWPAEIGRAKAWRNNLANLSGTNVVITDFFFFLLRSTQWGKKKTPHVERCIALRICLKTCCAMYFWALNKICQLVARVPFPSAQN